MNTPEIIDWHSHVYFDAASRDAAWALRETIEKSFEIEMGRFHEKPVGPHPQFSFQVHFRNEQFAPFMAWLTMNRGAGLGQAPAGLQQHARLCARGA